VSTPINNVYVFQVSWIRKRDAHILTVDRYTFIADERFQAFLVESTDTWTLQVKYVQARDAGQYECQVSTEPKMSTFITLNVVGEYHLPKMNTFITLNVVGGYLLSWTFSTKLSHLHSAKVITILLCRALFMFTVA